MEKPITVHRIAFAVAVPLLWALAACIAYWVICPGGIPGRYELVERAPGGIHTGQYLRFDRASGDLCQWTDNGWIRRDYALGNPATTP